MFTLPFRSILLFVNIYTGYYQNVVKFVQISLHSVY